VVGEVSSYVSPDHNLPEPVYETSTRKRLAILYQKQDTWHIAPAGKIGHHRVDRTKRMLAYAHVEEAAFPRGIGLRALSLHSGSG